MSRAAQQKQQVPVGDDDLWDEGLFGGGEAPPAAAGAYTAKDIEVLEGLEPVRKRPGMYIGGVDERALHHLFAEVLDNSMDEAVAGFADRIDVELEADGTLRVTDNGRGMPVDPHPKFPKKSALEIIMTVLHAGGKFSDKVYHTSGGLHGVGVSVVNALSDRVEVEVARERKLYRQTFSRGTPTSKLVEVGPAHNRRGTSVRFHPDAQIFGEGAAFKPARLFQMARSKAYLQRGVQIRWKCDASRIKDDTPAEAVLHFPNGLADFLAALVKDKRAIVAEPFTGRSEKNGPHGRVEWAVTWVGDGCARIATPSTRPTAASMKRACARLCPRACAPMPNCATTRKRR
jgi:topoisomerase IV subunit B